MFTDTARHKIPAIRWIKWSVSFSLFVKFNLFVYSKALRHLLYYSIICSLQAWQTLNPANDDLYHKSLKSSFCPILIFVGWWAYYIRSSTIELAQKWKVRTTLCTRLHFAPSFYTKIKLEELMKIFMVQQTAICIKCSSETVWTLLEEEEKTLILIPIVIF